MAEKKDVISLIGNTPLMRVDNYAAQKGVAANIYVKLEYFNPAGSSKDRTALYMIKDAISSSRLTPGGTIIEPTSGNTGIGLACIAANMGFKVILCMPDTMSAERISLIKAYGAQVVLTDGEKGMSGSIQKAEELNKSIPNSIIAGQFVNPANTLAHYETTGPEIYKDLCGKVDFLVAGVGTGGTISGCGKYLKEKNPKTSVVAVEPYDSPLLSKGESGSHGLMGIGANFVPDILNIDLLDEIIDVKTPDAYEEVRLLAKTEGYLVGISSGAALCAAVEIAQRKQNVNKNIVVICPDGGERYLSTGIFD